MIDRIFSFDVFIQDCERRADDMIVDSKAETYAFRKLCFPASEVAVECNDIAALQASKRILSRARRFHLRYVSQQNFSFIVDRAAHFLGSSVITGRMISSIEMPPC